MNESRVDFFPTIVKNMGQAGIQNKTNNMQTDSENKSVFVI